MKGSAMSVYSLWMLDKSVATASGIPVPFSSVSRSSLDLKKSSQIIKCHPAKPKDGR